MKPLTIQQNTPEWEMLRSEKIGASDIAILMDGSQREIHDLYLNKTTGKKKFKTDAMQRGSDMEGEARNWFNCHISKDRAFEPICALHDSEDWLMASFDGFVANEEGVSSLEIKCPGFIPDKIEQARHYNRWWWQVQAQFAVGGHSDSFVLIYSPERQSYGQIQRDEKAIEKLIEEGRKFYQSVISFNPPFEILPEREDEEMKNSLLEYQNAFSLAKEWEKKAKEAKEKVVSLANNKAFRCGDFVLKKVMRVGMIDYKSIPELRALDLEPYRQKPIEYWDIK
jgi:putative phage-type endonuclease